jgi:ABC-type proline/glycine betaine transport system substrate-binding protein
MQASLNSGGRRRTLVCVALAAALLPAAACSTQTPDERLKTELRTVASWAATVRKVCEDWQGGRVPTGYAAKALEAAQDELQTEAQTLSEDTSIPAQARAAAQGQIEQLAQAVGQAQGAVGRADATAMAQVLGQLDAAARPINSFVGR